jgi:P27 family predicted phage terminase small subunit
MGRRGPKPEAAAVKLAKGNPSRRPVGVDPIDEHGGAPVVDHRTGTRVVRPAWLTGEGRKIWERLAPRHSAMKLLGQSDAEAFARYCRNFARWLKMQKTLDREGETYESESTHGNLKRAHPAFLIADRLERQLLVAEANFGLNPAERQRIYAARAAAPNAPDLFGGENAKAEGDAGKAPPAPARTSAIGALGGGNKPTMN